MQIIFKTNFKNTIDFFKTNYYNYNDIFIKQGDFITMAKLSYEFLQSHQQNGQHGNKFSGNVGFFSLKNDGEKALVRILYTDPSEFEIYREHTITTVDSRIRSVNCLRENDAVDPIEKCPFCVSNEPRRDRFYIKMLQYTVDKNGNVVVEAKIWDRPFSFAKKIISKLSEYGPLTDCLVFIKRLGAKGDKNTTYEIDYAVAENKSPERYPLKPELFDGYNVLGLRVLNKTAEDMTAFLNSGEFPVKKSGNDNKDDYAPNTNTEVKDIPSEYDFTTPSVQNPQPTNQFATTSTPNSNLQFETPNFAPQFNPQQPPQFNPQTQKFNPQQVPFSPVTPNPNRTY